MKAYRHGEMILIPVPENLQDQWQNLFKQAGRKIDDPRVIAEGEITGHKHELTGGQVDAVALGNGAVATGTATSGSISPLCCQFRHPFTAQAKIPGSSASNLAGRFGSTSLSGIVTVKGISFTRRQIDSVLSGITGL